MAVRPKSVLSLSLGLLLSLVVIPLAAAQEYVVGPRDVLTITVWGQPDLSGDYPADRDGFLPFPLVGRVKAGGLTTQAFAARLTEFLEKDYLVNPQVIVSVKEYLSQKVLVLGEAGRPGVFYLTGPTTLVEILSGAGGLAKGAGKQILLVRDQHSPDHGGPTANTILRLDVDKVQAGTGTENIRVQAGDTVLIPKDREDTFFIFGEVKKPGAYPLDKETNILEGITIAGGFTDKAAPGRTRVIRVSATGQQILDIDMNDIIKRGQRDKAIRLQANDVVVVPESFF